MALDEGDTAMEEDVVAEDDGGQGMMFTLDLFREVEVVNNLITNIPITIKSDIASEKAFEDLKTILDRYQEQPHLLDPHLENQLEMLIAFVRNPSSSIAVSSQAFKYLWLIIKVRGYKNIVRKLPHEVKDLSGVLQLLEHPEMKSDFYSSYVLLMWLSIIVYMPFNMMGFDTTVMGATQSVPSESVTVVDRILSAIKVHLNCTISSREMAAYLASRFMTRLDIREKYLPDFITYCFEVFETVDGTDNHGLCHKLGVLRAIGLIFKHGKREELLPYSNGVLNKLIQLKIIPLGETPVRKLGVKIMQRIGLTFLKPKVASWRYQRGNRSLTINIEEPTPGTEKVVKSPTEEDDDYDEIPAEIEEIVDSLLLGLKDKDTVVRWSAAKGIGRVTGRLPRDFGDEVVGALLDLFSSRESDKAWHGGCLALAELARRGLLLPDRLPEVLPVLEKALIYDEQRGQCSVGSNIRDAACYLCWAFARAYHPDQLTPFVDRLATGLLIVALFDREIPCRRAGSAAFQEHVGRQGTFPHGIEILTTVDYHAVGIRSNAFLKLSVEVGTYSEYTNSLIDHLVEEKVGHWDSAIRDLAAKALHRLTRLSLEYVSNEVLTKLVDQTNCSILIVRHGSILAIAYILHGIALAAREQDKTVSDYVDNQTLKKVHDIVPLLMEKKLYRGMGGEYMKQASSVLIEKCSLAVLPFHGDDILDKWRALLEECIVYVEENIRTTALEALPVFLATYYQPLTPELTVWRDDLINNYIKNIGGAKEELSLGSAAALGCLPKDLLYGKFDVVLSALIGALEITPSTITWATKRKVAVMAILKIINTAGIDNDKDKTVCVCHENIPLIYKALLKSLDDYTMDRRGDIGAWVREASMYALQKFTSSVVENDSSSLTEEIMTEMVTRVSQQAVERIDRTRKVAGGTFSKLLYNKPALPNFPNRDEVEKIFGEQLCEEINWASESTTFLQFVQLLDLPLYQSRILNGLTYSLGGMSANLSRYTGEALQLYLNERADNYDQLQRILEVILDLFVENKKIGRFTLPLIKSLGDLISSNTVFDPVLEREEALLTRLVGILKKECTKCNDYHKLSATATVLCELLRINTPGIKSILTQISIFLGYQYPKVRAVTATSLLTALQDYGDAPIVPEENLDQIISILEETAWMDSMEDARRQRNVFCELVNIHAPQPKKK